MPRADAAFRRLVQEGLALIPDEFRPYLANVEVVVEDWAPEDLLDELEVPEDEDLYGVYLGTPLTERAFNHQDLPDRIVLYRCALEEDFPDPEDLRREVAITVLHEIAHHFGLDEDRLEELGY